ncbi:MAG: hypothetical protein ACUVQ1_01770 [Candidatus Kapaibacteriales bacterium]
MVLDYFCGSETTLKTAQINKENGLE